ncbi:uncharacterized protein N7496_011743 [Penicillium cataractarum]|uniref:Uncharacterized protein n=1 Tax=Penicillium cataractarum TaxID=2100454 RepID=A0A9W9RFP3_9EURO|nr:uncharacterized protein N7496_011743 [Penicillium cataractarum]KAJ5359330.1 hypothetical protein N7496_011743 [Penicillium cataractarum]
MAPGTRLSLLPAGRDTSAPSKLKGKAAPGPYSSSSPSTPNFTPSPPSPTWCCYSQNDVLLSLSTSTIVLDSTFNFTESTCLIYAESIILDISTPAQQPPNTFQLSLPGKNLGLFCHSFSTAGDKSTILDVSGSKGQAVAPVAQGNGTTGNDGGRGGSVWFYVENFTDDIQGNFKIAACGGDGSPGGTTTAKDCIGGTGGSGGPGGAISIYYGSVAQNVLTSLQQLVGKPWPTQVTSGQNSLLPSCETLSPDFDPSVLEDVSNILSNYAPLNTSLASLPDSLNSLLHNDIAQPQQQTVQVATACSKALIPWLASPLAPPQDSIQQTLNNVNSLISTIAVWAQNYGGNVQEQQIQQLCPLLTSAFTIPPSSGLESCWEMVGMQLENIIGNQQNGAKLMANVSGGIPGIGGYGGSTESPDGKPGNIGTLAYRNLLFDGSTSDLNVDQVCAFPEECQMILNQADRYFFANDPSSIQQATILYSRLVQRLNFIPTLLTPAAGDTTPPPAPPPLQKAYDYVQDVLGLTITALPQLQTILSQATHKLGNISLGYDMFGHAANWAPRVSYGFYESEISSGLRLLQQVEQANNAYANALQQQESAAQALSASLQNNLMSQQDSQEQINLIVGNGGILEMSAAKITKATPTLQQKMDAIKKAMTAVETDIQNYLNLNPMTLLTAFASFAMAPSSLTGLAQMGTVDYQAFTTVPNLQGVNVNKSYILSQLTTCGNSLASLSEAFTTASDGTIDVDDPGSLKIIKDIDDIDTLVASYKEAIPEADSKALSGQLDDYLDIIEQRNQAVMDYNAALQLLNQVITKSNYYGQQGQVMGNEALEVNPNLPAIYFWLQNIQQDTAYDVMQRLNYAARAICFWGLEPQPAFTAPGPLQGSVDLANNQQELVNRFDDAVTGFAPTAWSIWPPEGSRNIQGHIYTLSQPELYTLLRPTTDPDNGKAIYGVDIGFSASDPPSIFSGMANIRLSQVRVWLPNAKVSPDASNRQLLMVEITHLGTETILSPSSGTPTTFSHDPVTLQFQYNATNITSIQQCTSSVVMNSESIEQDYTGEGTPGVDTLASLGPFATWSIQIKASENAGLDLSAVNSAYVEFWGRNMALMGGDEEMDRVDGSVSKGKR